MVPTHKHTCFTFNSQARLLDLPVSWWTYLCFFLLLFLPDMSAGHFSASDRYKHMKEQAFEYAFVLDVLGCTSLVAPAAATAAASGGGDGSSTAPASSRASL